MANGLIFVHGINNGVEERKTLTESIIGYLERNRVLHLFRKKDNPGFTVTKENHWVKAVTWNSRGKFMRDINNLSDPRTWKEAVSTIVTGIETFIAEMNDAQALDELTRLVFVFHSMGQPLGISAMYEIQSHFASAYKIHIEKSGVITIGGPMGNPLARAWLYNMNQKLWAGELKVRHWHDIWNPEDLVCGSFMYEKFLAAQPHRIDIPGHPTPFTPLKEHSSYFFSEDFYRLIDECVFYADLRK